MAIRTADGEIEAYIFERHVDAAGFEGVKSGLSRAPGVAFVGQFVGAFNLFARVVAGDLGELQRRIANEYWEAGVRSDFSINLTGDRPAAPKRASPNICALVCAQVTQDPFDVLDALDELFLDVIPYGAALVTAPDFDVLVDIGGDTIEDVVDRVFELRGIPGIGRTSTALADLAENAIRPGKG